MTRPFSVRSEAVHAAALEDQFEIAPSASSAERLRRWAELVASGAAPLPVELEPEQLRTVLREVARLRRERLVRLVARAIAYDLQGDREPS